MSVFGLAVALGQHGL